MKKICMVAYTNYLFDARPRREAETLARRGDSVDFISLSEPGSAAIETINGVRLLRLQQNRYRGSSGLRYTFAYFRFLFAASVIVARLFRRERYDVIYVHTMPDLLVLVGLVPKLFGAKVVLNIHDMMPELYMSKFGISQKHWLIRLLTLQEQCSIWLADEVICVHHPHRNVLCRRGAPLKKITVLPNVPDPSIMPNRVTPSGLDTAFRIVYHGTITRRLGLDLAVRAFERIAAACPNARLQVFGTGDAAEDLATQIAASDAGRAIHFSNKMFRVESIAQMIQGAAVGIVPNRRDVATEYMLPVKMLEYIYLGIPVIAPRLRAIQYYFAEGQVVFYEPGNVDELAACIRRLYLNPAERESLVHRSAEFAKKFSWETLKEDLFKVVDSSCQDELAKLKSIDAIRREGA
jgi:glycosyltransferase involved in cell wall biosynthesis